MNPAVGAVAEISGRSDNKGSKDRIYGESFVSFIAEEEGLQEIIVKKINKSLLPNPAKSESVRLSRVRHVMTKDYLMNNRNHVLVTAIFASFFILRCCSELLSS